VVAAAVKVKLDPAVCVSFSFWSAISVLGSLGSAVCAAALNDRLSGNRSAKAISLGFDIVTVG